jgi:chemotaxis protein MotB
MRNLLEIPKYSGSRINQMSLKKTSNRLCVPRKQPPSETGNEVWFLTLSDLLMLLMICFVLLFGITLNQKNTVAATPTVPEKQERVTLAESTPLPLIQPESVERSRQAAAVLLEADLLQILGSNQARQGITVERRSNYVVLTFPEQIIFDSGQAKLKPTVSPVLEKVAVFIQSHSGLLLEIQGHTDNRPINNRRYPSNWELSADRATQVAKALMNLGIPPTIVSTKGFGEYHPLYPNDSEQNRLKNRRVELQFSSYVKDTNY